MSATTMAIYSGQNPVNLPVVEISFQPKLKYDATDPNSCH